MFPPLPQGACHAQSGVPLHTPCFPLTFLSSALMFNIPITLSINLPNALKSSTIFRPLVHNVWTKRLLVKLLQSSATWSFLDGVVTEQYICFPSLPVWVLSTAHQNNQLLNTPSPHIKTFGRDQLRGRVREDLLVLSHIPALENAYPLQETTEIAHLCIFWTQIGCTGSICKY